MDHRASRSIGTLSDFVFTSLQGFRIFTFSLAGWMLATGFSLAGSNQGNHE
jgi:cell shape-determining protein MreD